MVVKKWAVAVNLVVEAKSKQEAIAHASECILQGGYDWTSFDAEELPDDDEPVLSQEQLDRQDEVDNECQALLQRLSNKVLGWDIALITKVRDAAQEVLVSDLKLMTEDDFYP
jgi:hypothetical protein